MSSSISGTTSSSIEGGGGGGGGGPSAGPSQLAALHYDSLAQAAASTGSSLWGQLQEKFPDIRNATQYYATEAQRYGATLLEEAQKQQQQLSGRSTGEGHSRDGGGGRGPRVTNLTRGGNELPAAGADEGTAVSSLSSPPNEGATMAEVHYQPNPIGALGLTVRSTDVVTLSGTGEIILCMCIDQGFACFEVTPTAVFEVAVDLGVALNPMSRVSSSSSSSSQQQQQQQRSINNSSGTRKSNSNSIAAAVGSGGSSSVSAPQPPGGPNSYVIDVQPLNLHTFILLTSTGWLLAVHVGGGRSSGPAGATNGSANSFDDFNSTATGNNNGSTGSTGVHLVGYCQVNTASPKALKLMRGGQGASVVVSSTEFAQLTVYSIQTICGGGGGGDYNDNDDDGSRYPSPYSASLSGGGGGDVSSSGSNGNFEIIFTEGATLCGETTVFATSGNWLAYSGQADAAKTIFVNAKTESNLESVAHMALNGLSKLKTHGLGAMWGTSPGLGPTTIPLGSVVIHNLWGGTSVGSSGGGENLSFTSSSVTSAAAPQATGDFASFSAHNHPIQMMKWDSTGTLLATASTVGTSVNVFQVMPVSSSAEESSNNTSTSTTSTSTADAGATSSSSSEVALVYRLTRGVTQNTIVDISFGGYNSWIAVCSATGTCHFYKVPRADQMLHGKRAATHPARNLSAVCRARSAPSTTPVCPHFVFTPSVLSIGGSLHGVEGCLVTQSGTVNWITCTEEGANLGYTKSIDAFSGDKGKVVQASLAHFATSTSANHTIGEDAASSENKTRVSPFLSGCGVVADMYFNRAAGLSGVGTPAAVSGDSPSDFAAYDAQWRAQIELSTHDASLMERNSAPLLPKGSNGGVAAPVKVKPTHVDPHQAEDEWDDC